MKYWKAIILLFGGALCGCSLKKQDVNFYDYNVIAHACGEIDGYTYTDSLEALNRSYENGDRLFDIDLRFSSDGEIVLRHEWQQDLGQPEFAYLMQYQAGEILREQLPTLEQFKNTLIFSKYTSLSFRDIVGWMKSHPDAYMVLDTKEDPEETYTWIVKKFKEDKEILNHLVPSCYSSQDLKTVLKIYSFKNYMLRQYADNLDGFDEFISDCNKYHVKAVSVSLRNENDERIQNIRNNGMKIYWAVENKIEEYEEKYIWDGVVSDWIKENDINNLEKNIKGKEYYGK